MATPSLEYLNTVWQYLPQGHEKPLKQAFYNTVANIFVIIASAVAVAVYFILAPFIRPLYWAVLCGTFLYPFKRSLTNVLRTWLKRLHSSGTPFAVGAVVLPFEVTKSALDTLSNGIWANFKLLLGVVFGLPAFYLLYISGYLHSILYTVQSILSFLYHFLGYFSSLWVWTLFIAYIVGIVFLWTPDSQRWLRFLAVPIWVALLLHISTIAGTLRAPLLLFMVVVVVVGFVVEIGQARQAGDGDAGMKTSPSLYTTICSVLGISSHPDVEKEESSPAKETESASVEQGPVVKGPPTTAPKPTSLPLNPQKLSETPVTRREPTEESQKTSGGEGEPEPEPSSLSHQYFVALLWGHVLVRLWMHFWIILLLFLLPIVHMLAKTIVHHYSSGGMLHDQVQSARKSFHQWVESRKDVLMPRSLRGLVRLIHKGDQKIVLVLEQGVDNATSTLLILMLLIGTVLFSVIGAVQIQRESMYMVTSAQNVLNNTMNSEFSQWMPDADVMRSTIDDVMQKTHEYGRNFIASKVKEFVNGNEEEQENLVNQVLEVWDRVYEAWKSNSKEDANNTSIESPAVMSGVDTLWQMVSKGGGVFQLSSLVAFVQENLGTFMSVLESVWAVVKGNMSLVLTIITSIISAVLGGGTAILNFVLSAVIFLTTLFYLLASSGDMYKPAELFSSMSPGSTGSRFGQAVEEAISGVFMASLKMAAFYGLYTWLIHLIFGLDIVFIPSALAAVFAAVPFLGPYWAALPAVIELWLVQGRGLSALVLFVAHMLPSYVVDTAIYSEIKGGHPFVTGLAIAGGMYCMGLEGALIGPIILCCLIVVVNMYSRMLQSDPSTPTPARAHFNLRSLMAQAERRSDYKSARSVSSDSMCVH